jgi:lysophospholipase L1-like esterase
MLLLLVGDSTVTDDAGWGSGFRARVTADCLNHAQGGRSSKSYRGEGHWQTALDVGADVILIQFGHNDEPGKGPERETDPDGTFTANLARYVAEARATGAVPVLVTSLARRNFQDTGEISPRSLHPYVVATRRVAAEYDVPLIDLNAAAIELCHTLGPAGCEQLSPRKPDGGIDATHLNAAGGLVFGSLVADLARAAVPALRPYLTPAPAEDPLTDEPDGERTRR